MAIFLTSLAILDTGFLTKAKTGSQLATGSRANSGSAFLLKGVRYEDNTSCNLDESAIPGKFSGSTVPVVSINPDTFTLTLFLNVDNTDTSNLWGVNDMGMLSELRELPKTQGLKAMYYPIKTTASGDLRARDKQMIYQLGTADSSQPQGDISISAWDGSAEETGLDLTNVKYVSVRFKSYSAKQAPNNKLEITLTGVYTD